MKQNLAKGLENLLAHNNPTRPLVQHELLQVYKFCWKLTISILIKADDNILENGFIPSNQRQDTIVPTLKAVKDQNIFVT